MSVLLGREAIGLDLLISIVNLYLTIYLHLNASPA